jgi:hypothetical protein
LLRRSLLGNFLILGEDGEVPPKWKNMEIGHPRKEERLIGDQRMIILYSEG